MEIWCWISGLGGCHTETIGEKHERWRLHLLIIYLSYTYYIHPSKRKKVVQKFRDGWRCLLWLKFSSLHFHISLQFPKLPLFACFNRCNMQKMLMNWFVGHLHKWNWILVKTFQSLLTWKQTSFQTRVHFAIARCIYEIQIHKCCKMSCIVNQFWSNLDPISMFII